MGHHSFQTPAQATKSQVRRCGSGCTGRSMGANSSEAFNRDVSKSSPIRFGMCLSRADEQNQNTRDQERIVRPVSSDPSLSNMMRSSRTQGDESVEQKNQKDVTRNCLEPVSFDTKKA